MLQNIQERAVFGIPWQSGFWGEKDRAEELLTVGGLGRVWVGDAMPLSRAHTGPGLEAFSAQHLARCENSELTSPSTGSFF